MIWRRLENLLNFKFVWWLFQGSSFQLKQPPFTEVICGTFVEHSGEGWQSLGIIQRFSCCIITWGRLDTFRKFDYRTEMSELHLIAKFFWCWDRTCKCNTSTFFLTDIQWQWTFTFSGFSLCSGAGRVYNLSSGNIEASDELVCPVWLEPDLNEEERDQCYCERWRVHDP